MKNRICNVLVLCSLCFCNLVLAEEVEVPIDVDTGSPSYAIINPETVPTSDDFDYSYSGHLCFSRIQKNRTDNFVIYHGNIDIYCYPSP